MSIGSRELRELSSAIAGTVPTPRAATVTRGVVTSTGDGVWVLLEGADAPTPAQASTCAVSPGDQVSVRIQDGSATVTGNVTQPAQTASAVAAAVRPAQSAADDALAGASVALESAKAAQADADRAHAAADQATADAATARAKAEQAIGDAARAKDAADSAQASASTAADNAAASGVAASIAQRAAEAAQAKTERAQADAAEVRAAYERGDFFTPTLDLVSTNGTQFRNGEVDTTLVATVRWAGLAITSTTDLKAKLGEPYHLRWGVSQEGGAVGYLEDFDERIGADGFELSVTKRDVGERATFFCDLMSE